MNKETILSGKAYADLSVRDCMDWNKKPEDTLYIKFKNFY
jgi:hypothetical protein